MSDQHQMYRRPEVGPAGGPAAPGPRVVEVTGEPEGPRPERPGWSRGTRLLTASVVLVLVLGAVAMALTYDALNPTLGSSADSGRPAAGAGGLPGTDPAAPARGEAVTAALEGRSRAGFELVDGLTTLTLSTADLGGDLFRITSPPGSGVLPDPRVAGDQVRLRVDRTDHGGPGILEVVLNSRVQWRLQVTGGVEEQVLDLQRGRPAGVELLGGSRRIELRLPEVTGTLPVRMSGGVNELLIRAAGDPPARVRAASGAGTIRVYDESRAGIAAGTVLGSPGWEEATDRIWVDLVAGANQVTVQGS